MSKTFAQILAYILHPVLMPTLGVAGIMALSPYYISKPVFLLTIFYVFMGTYILPSILIFSLWKLRIISSVHLENAKERRYPYLLTALFFYLTAISVKDFQVPDTIAVYLFSGVLVIGIALVLLSFTKISAHMAGMGGLLALTFYLSYNYSIELLFIISAILLAAGLLGAARLRLKAHSPLEVYLGFFLGLCSTLLVLFGI